MKPNAFPLVYVVVLCHNSGAWLYKCITSLLHTDYSNFKIILVDNASNDGSIIETKKLSSQICIIENKNNLGWCQGNNIGIKKALKEGAEFIVLLNSDIEAGQREWLSTLINFSLRKPEYGILGCVQYEYNNNDWRQINSWTKYILSNGTKDVLFMWDKKYQVTANDKNYTEIDLTHREFLDCYFVQGAAMMIKREVFEKIGFFDEIYFIFYDEVDFSRRARLVNIKTALVTNSKIKHVGSGDNSSNAKARHRRNFYFSRNKYIFLFTDTQRRLWRSFGIFIKLLKNDICDATGRKQDIAGIPQLLHIFFSLLSLLPRIIKKRNRDKKIILLINK